MIPKRGSEGAAGLDLSSIIDATIPPGGKMGVPTGVAIKLPQGVYGRIAPRSGLAYKKHIGVGAGVIDPDFTGELQVILFNHAKEDFVIKAGDRIAQLVLEKFSDVPCVEVDELPSTQRGEIGFGSTGTSQELQINKTAASVVINTKKRGDNTLAWQRQKDELHHTLMFMNDAVYAYGTIRSERASQA